MTQVRGYARSDGTLVAPHTRRASFFFAKRRHAGQTRADGITPYIHHPARVLAILREAGIDDPAVLDAALLHDTVEDTRTTPAEIGRKFGPVVQSLVEELTMPPDLHGAAKKAAQVGKMRGLSAQATAIKLADRAANLEDLIANPPPGWSTAKRRAYVEHAAALASAAGEVPGGLWGHLAALIAQGRTVFTR